jgi:hypothetical protein
MYLKQLVESIGVPNVTGVLFEDNTSAITIAENPVCGSRTKHMEERLHYVRYVISKSWLTLRHLNTTEQIADLFTKPLALRVFQYLSRKFMNYPI